MKLTKWLVLGAALLISSPVFATTYYGGFEDTTGSGSDYDYNDMVFSLSGSSLSLHTSTGVWASAPVLGTSGTPFWNNASYDGPKDNVGYCIYGGGTCNGGKAIAPGALYLATPTGGSVNDVYFSTNGAIGEQLYLSIAADSNVLGWELASGVGGEHYFTGTGAQSFTATGDFVLLGKVNCGTVYNSNAVAASGRSDFAFFSATPEPSTMGMFGIALMASGLVFRKRFAAKK